MFWKLLIYTLIILFISFWFGAFVMYSAMYSSCIGSIIVSEPNDEGKVTATIGIDYNTLDDTKVRKRKFVCLRTNKPAKK